MDAAIKKRIAWQLEENGFSGNEFLENEETGENMTASEWAEMFELSSNPDNFDGLAALVFASSSIFSY